MSKPDMTPISRFPDLEKPGRERLNQLFRLFILTIRGDILTRGATYLKRLALGAAGTVLHSDGTDVEWAVLKASEVEVEELSTATYDDVQDFINFFGDRTILSGGTITAHGDADGKVVIAACTAWCKVTDSTTAIGKFFDYAGKVSQTLTDLSANFIYLDYNGGTPQVVVATALLTYSLKLDHILLGVVFRNGTATHIHNTDHIGISGIGRSNLHWLEHFLVHRVAGAVTSEAGTRQLAVTAGVVYAGLSRNATNAFNTNNSDTFSYWYYDGDAGPAVWVEVTGQTVISNTQYNALATGLANLSAAAKRGVHWVYLDNDGVHLHVVYGQGDYSTAEAELAAVPTLLPPLVTNYCVLIAKIIVQKDQDIMYISYPWTSAFQTSLAADHGSLAGLDDDDHAQYIKDTEFTAANDTLVGTGSGTFAKKTPAEVLAILSGDAGAAFSWNDKVLTALAGILATAETELTIDTDGEITVTQMRHKVDTFEDAASDDLSTINGGTTVNLIILRAEADARTVVLKHGTGNIWLQGKADVSLDDLEDGILLVWDSTNSKWFDIAAGGTAGASTALDNLASVAINTSLISDGDNTDNLGSDAVRWKDLFLSGVIECLGGIWDDDQDTGIQVEESADEDIIRMDVGGTEAFHLSAIGELTLAKQSMAEAVFSEPVGQLYIQNGKWVLLPCDTESFDNQNELDTTRKTGTASATSASHLIDTTLNPFVAGDVGAQIFNTTDNTCAKITVYNNTSDVTIDADIMASGETYELQRCRFTATEDGKYIVAAGFAFLNCEDQKRVALYTYVNGAGGRRILESHTSGTQVIGGTGLVFHDLSATDYVEVNIYNTGTVGQRIVGGTYVWVGFIKVA